MRFIRQKLAPAKGMPLSQKSYLCKRSLSSRTARHGIDRRKTDFQRAGGKHGAAAFNEAMLPVRERAHGIIR
jgi:hypothetical protein